MAENIEIANPAVAVLDRLPMRDEDAKFATNSSMRSRARSMPPTRRFCAPWLRSCTRPTSAI